MQHQKLINAAKKLGASITDVSDMMERETAIVSHMGKSELVMDGVPTSWINVRSQFYCDNKQLTKLAYEALGIAYPKSLIFKNGTEKALVSFFEKEKKYVCKPLDATNGIGVVLDITSLEMVKNYYETHQDLGTLFLLEEQAEGEDLRIHVIGGRIVAACVRKPAFVLGNGQDSLEKLIEQRQAVMKTQNPKNFLTVDAVTKKLLTAQGLTLASIPAAGQTVQLKHIANMAQGGVAIDVTEEIHPVYHEWVKALSEYLETKYFGLDVMTTDFTKSPNEAAKVLEINARADWMHHTFSERRTHDMADIILKELFYAPPF